MSALALVRAALAPTMVSAVNVLPMQGCLIKYVFAQVTGKEMTAPLTSVCVIQGATDVPQARRTRTAMLVSTTLKTSMGDASASSSSPAATVANGLEASAMDVVRPALDL